MAFGFGFNKQKTLSSAEKYVQQGKISNAISEYQKVIKADSKDLTVTNTVGDLYSRLGEVDKATECFKTVGDAYASQGFTVKAIAMYKKISKLKPSLESVLKLAELYTQQGLFNDARSQYLQVAEEFLKANELDNAVRIFQKILEMDPDNTTMRIRLAEVYVRLQKKTEAWQIFSAAAEALRAKGSLSASDEVLQRMLTLDPGNSYALLMRGRNQLQSGDAAAAIESFHKISDLDSNREGLNDLFKAFLKTGRLSDAGALARKLLSVHNDLAPTTAFADALMQAGQFDNALQVYDEHADRMMAEDSEKVVRNLHTIIGHVRENATSLEKLLALFHKAGESTHVNEVTELLAHASVQAGDLPKARDLYQKLAAAEPGNPIHLNHYQQVVNQLGGPSPDKMISAEEAAVIVDELEATSPQVPQHYPDAIALAVRAALTDAELFISYNMPAKALGPLTAALPKAPRDLRLNQRLAALHTRAGRFAEAGVCCRILQEVYSHAGYPEEATRYNELADRYETRSHSSPAAEAAAAFAAAAASKAPSKLMVQTAAAKSAAAAPWPAPNGADEPEFAIVADQTDAVYPSDRASVQAAAKQGLAPGSTEPAEEIDLSSEWDDAITVDVDGVPTTAADETEPAVAPVAGEVSGGIAEIVEELRFYLDHGMPEQAAAVFARLETLISDEATLAPLRSDVHAALHSAPAPPEQIATVEAEAAPTVESDTSAEFAIDLAPAEDPTFSIEFPTSEEPAVPTIELDAASEPQFEIASLETAEDEPGFATAQGVEDAVIEVAVPSEVLADAPVTQQPESIAPEALSPAATAIEIGQESVAEPAAPISEPSPAPDPMFGEIAISEVAAEAAPTPGVLNEFVSDLESSISGNFDPPTVEEVDEITAQAAETPANPDLQPVSEAAPTVFGAHQTDALGEFVADIEASLGEGFLKDAPVAAPVLAPAEPIQEAMAAAASQGVSAVSHAPVSTPEAAMPGASFSSTHSVLNIESTAVAPAPQQSAAAPAIVAPAIIAPAIATPATVSKSSSPFGNDAGVDLAEMFGELKQDLESGSGSNDEDPETHYNLGIAFREMGLLDEAIGELQKTCQAVDRGHPFPQVMQTYTWLAQCFLDKGVPEAAIRWYDKALNAKGIGEETRTALHYELGTAYEACGDKASALKSFMEVYGRNIDYRDVAERIKQLR